MIFSIKGINNDYSEWTGGISLSSLLKTFAYKKRVSDFSSETLFLSWAKMDSNHRRRKPADLQSAPFGHSGICPFAIAITPFGAELRCKDMVYF